MKVTPLFFTLLLSTQVMAQGDFKFSTIKRNSLERIKFTSNNNGLFRNKTSILDLPGRETKYITETEVRSYIEKTYLTDEVKKSLYFMAGNYDDYLVSVSKWVDSLYNKGLAEFTYHQLVKEEIYRLKLESQIQLDTASENDLYRVMEELEDKMLDGFYESGKGIKYAKEMAGQSLKKSFYPYEEGDSGFDIYNKWYKSNLVIQKQKLLNNQSDLYEQFLVYEKLSRGSIQFDLKSNVMPEYNRLKNLALELKDKDFTSSEYEKVKNDHRDVFTILSSVSFPSLNSSFSQFVNLDQGLKVNQMNYFSRLLDSFEADGSIQESLDLISKAREIVNKFLTENNDKDIVKEKLLKLVDKERKAFQSSEGTYKNFILQVLYQVAGSLLYSELSISDQELAQHFLSSLGQFVNSIMV